MLYYIRKSWKINVAAVILIVLAAVLQVVASAYNMEIINTMVAGNIAELGKVILRLIGLWILITFAVYVRNLVRAKAIATMHNQLRADLTTGISKLSPQKFRSNETGVYLSWYTNDIQQLDTSSFSNFFGVVSKVAILLGTLIVLFWLSWILAVVCVFGSVVMMLIPKLFEKKANQAGAELSAFQEQFLKKIKSTLEGFPVLKFFNRVPYFERLLQDASFEVEEKKYAYTKFTGKMEAVFTFISIVFQLGVSFLTALLSIWQLVPIGAILSVGNLVGFLSGAIETLANSSVTFAMGAPVWKKFREVKESVSQDHGELSLSYKKSIDFRDVSFHYGKKTVLNHLNLEFQKGGKYAIVGASGCGKTTVLKLLMRYLDDYTGEILIDGKDIHDYTLTSLYQQISYIDQEVYMFDDTILQNVTLGESFTEEEISAAIRDSALEMDIQKMPDGLNTQVGENGRRLSGGQKQRVAIARALLHGQKILLMDEGTSALDKENAYLVESKLLANPNLTVILVSHHLDEKLMPQFNDVYYLGKK
jgi:ABC-type multidrug transport system fused ATPase/permease subunit